MSLHRRSAEPDDARDGNAYHSLATPRSGAGEIVMVRATKEPGASSPAHSHDREEVVLILSGRAVARVGEETWQAGSGDTLIIPPGVLHEVSCPGPEPLECVVGKSAGIRFFDAEGREMPLPVWMT